MRLIQKFGLIGDLIRYRCFHHRRTDGGNPCKVLIVRLDRIGDFMLYAPFAAALRRQFPKSHLTLLCRPIWSDLARNQLGFDTYEELEPDLFLAQSGYRRTLLKQIAAAKYDLVLQPRFHRELLVEDLITLASGAPESIAFAGTSLHIRKHLLRPWDGIYGKLVPAKPYLNSHELTRNFAFSRELPAFDGGYRNWSTPPLPAPFPAPGSYAVILPGSGKKNKAVWPPERFGRLTELVASQGLNIIICGTEDEQLLAEAVATHCPATVADLTGKQTIAEFAATVAHAALVIGNDTGGIHIAAMSGVPSLAVCGQGQPGIFLPYPPEAAQISGVRPPVVLTRSIDCAGCNWLCKFRGTRREFRCIAEISAEDAVECLTPMLEELSEKERQRQ